MIFIEIETPVAAPDLRLAELGGEILTSRTLAGDQYGVTRVVFWATHVSCAIGGTEFTVILVHAEVAEAAALKVARAAQAEDVGDRNTNAHGVRARVRQKSAFETLFRAFSATQPRTNSALI